jgi:hypothetical protein
MSTPSTVERDERTVSVENASYRWAYAFLSYTLLLDVIYRSLFRHEGAWDLMALVIAGGVVCTIYQTHQKVLSRGWAMKAALGACIAVVIAFVLAMAF